MMAWRHGHVPGITGGMLTCIMVIGTIACGIQPAVAQKGGGDSPMANACGQYALAAVLQHCGKNVRFQDIVALLPVSKKGSNLAQLGRIAEGYECKTYYATMSPEALLECRRPAILHVNGNHFIAVLPDHDGAGLTAIDLARTARIRDPKDLRDAWQWNGECMLVDTVPIAIPAGMTTPSRPWWHYVIGACGLSMLAVSMIRLVMRRRRRGDIVKNLSVVLSVLLAGGLAHGRDRASSAPAKRGHPAEQGSPRLLVDKDVCDAGVVYEDTDVIHSTFILRNIGQETLEIMDVKKDCSCTVTTMPTQVVKAGDSVPIQVDYQIKGAFGRLADRHIWVVTNEPNNAAHVLTIQAEHRKDFTVDPGVAHFGRVSLGEEHILLIKITPGSVDRKCEPSRSSLSMPYLQVEEIGATTDAPASGASYLLRLRLRSSDRIGVLNGIVSVPCSGGQGKTIDIPVTAEVVGPIQCSVTEMRLGVTRPGDREKTMYVTVSSKEAFDVEEIRCRAPWLSVSRESINSKTYRVAVTMDPEKAPPGVLSGEIHVKTNVKGMRSFVIPVSGFCLGSKSASADEKGRSVKAQSSQ